MRPAFRKQQIGGPISTPGALMAVRKGQYKLHMYTQGSHCKDGYPDQQCWCDATTPRRRPVLDGTAQQHTLFPAP